MQKVKREHRKISWVQICWIAVAVILFVAGRYAHVNQNINLVDLSVPLGCAMLTTGIINMVVCLVKSHDIHGSRWLVTDGTVAVLLSFFPLFNEVITPVMIPLFFGMWELFSGMLKYMDSLSLKEEKLHCWIGFAAIGAIELVSGTLSLMKPIDDLVGINEVIAIIFFVQSAGFVLKAAMYRQLVA